MPKSWILKYNLYENGDHYSVGGSNMVMIGFDQISLSPQMCENSESLGVQISKSSITGKLILSGRAVDSDSQTSTIRVIHEIISQAQRVKI